MGAWVGRWIRLDAEWEESEWVATLSGQARGCWPRLLCWVKLRGKRGRCRWPAPRVLASTWRVPFSAVEQMLEAAQVDGAIIHEGDELVIVNWSEYQEPDPTAAERKRNERARKSPPPPPPDPVTPESRSVTDVTRDKGVTCHATPDPQPVTTTAHVGTAQARAKGGAELAGWLGPDGPGLVERFVLAHAANSRAVESIRATYAARSMVGERVWGGVPPPERPPILASAIEAFAGEGKAYQAKLFQVFVEDRIRGNGRRGNGRSGAGAGGESSGANGERGTPGGRARGRFSVEG